ncbi:hypothetical protein NG791_21040 [Laspinema sp. D1]|uniref:hypothetical protein n=1 Tax=Laspinema palackyanum TaxID=3231601 RepID=UPI003488A9A7|nr:hypothetical protein [Laspinema sp. D2b]
MIFKAKSLPIQTIQDRSNAKWVIFFISQVFNHIIASIAYQDGENPSPRASG